MKKTYNKPSAKLVMFDLEEVLGIANGLYTVFGYFDLARGGFYAAEILTFIPAAAAWEDCF